MIPKDTTRPIRVFAQSKHWSFWQSHRFGDWRSLLIPKAILWLTPGFVLLSWTLRGAHLLLQTRRKVLNNELEEVFRRWYPQFRPKAA